MPGPEEGEIGFRDDPTRKAGATPPGSTDAVSPEAPTLDQAASPRVLHTGWLAPGDDVGPFRIRRVIGEGGFGVVYEAEQSHPIRRTVALKVLKPGMDTQEIIVRFEGERQALALLDHPGIAKILDAGVTNAGRPYFAMELVPGVPITRFCDDGRLTLDERVRLMIATCDAVQHAHQRGIIHRDIKPSNILVQRESDRPDAAARVRIIDFGIAKVTAPGMSRAQTLEGHFLGTPEYMSPEQASTAGVDADVRSDVYSIGVTLYELLTGRLPIEPPGRGAALDMLRLLREQDPVRPSARYADVAGSANFAQLRHDRPASLMRALRGDLDWILLKCLEKDRERRYVSVHDLALDLERSRSGQPVLAGPPSTIYRAGKFARRHRLALGAAGAVLLALVAGLALASYGLIQARDQRDMAVREREKSEQSAIAANKAKADAEREATTSSSVRKFLQEMIAAGDPEKGATRDMTVRSVIDHAAAGLDGGSLKDQPLVEAEVRQTLGDAYLSLGLLPEAEKQIRKNVELRRATMSAGSFGIAESVNSLAYLLDEEGKYEEAEKLYREVVAILSELRASQPLNLAVSKNNLAALLRRTNRLDEAEALWAEALAILRSVPESTDPAIPTLIGQNLGNQALCKSNRGRLDEAEALQREALEVLRKAEGPSSPSIARTLSSLATVLQDKGKHDEAERLFIESLEMQRKFFEAPHPQLATSLNNLATLYVDMGEAEKALPLFRESLSMCEQSLGKEHHDTVFARMNLGLALDALGDLPGAKEQFELAESQARRDPIPNAGMLPKLLLGLGEVRIEAGDLPGAEAALRESVRRYEELYGKGNTQGAGAKAALAAALVREGKTDEAVELAREALAIRTGAATPDSWMIAESKGVLGSALAATGKKDEGLRMMEESAEFLAGKRGASPATIRGAYLRLAWYYDRAKDAKNAEKYRALAAGANSRASERKPAAAGANSTEDR